MSTHKAKWLVLLANATAAAALRPGAPHARVLFCLGGPGAGKGTQCARLEHEFGWAHVSAGELLRAARAGGSEESRVIADCLDRGAIVPVADAAAPAASDRRGDEARRARSCGGRLPAERGQRGRLGGGRRYERT